MEPTFLPFQNQSTMVGGALGVDDTARLIPSMISSAAIPIVQAFATQPLDQNLAFDSVVGDAGATDVETPIKTPDGFCRFMIAVELSHNDTTSQVAQFGIRWDRSGGSTTSIALVSAALLPTLYVLALPRAERVILPPNGRIYGSLLALTGGRLLTLKIAYVDVPLGGTFPP